MFSLYISKDSSKGYVKDEEKEATGRQISAESMNDSRASQQDTMDYPERGAAPQQVVFQAQTEQKIIKASNGCLEEMLFKKSLQPGVSMTLSQHYYLRLFDNLSLALYKQRSL